jgi:hypothetical protein
MEMKELAIPVATLVCKRHMEMAIRCLGSFLRYCRSPVGVHVFEDGSLEESDRAKLMDAFPSARLYAREGRDLEFEAVLDSKPNCRRHRARNPMMLKLLDVPLTIGRPYFYCDTDVLFLKAFSLEGVRARLDTDFVFMRDIRQGYSAGLRQFVFHPGLKILSQVNAGVMAVPFGRYDLDFVEWFLGHEPFHVFGDVIEQSCWATMPNGKGAALVDGSQLICFGRTAKVSPETIGIHFIGSTKTQMGGYFERSESTAKTESPAIALRLEQARTAGALDVLVTGVRNRLLPAHLR